MKLREYLLWAAIGVNLYWAWRFWLATRRHDRLNDTLFMLVCNAFLMRHVPIWTAWSNMTGLHFHVGLQEEINGKGRRAKGTSQGGDRDARVQQGPAALRKQHRAEGDGPEAGEGNCDVGSAQSFEPQRMNGIILVILTVGAVVCLVLALLAPA